MKGYERNPVLTHPAVVQAAMRAQRTPVQVVLRWALQQGQVSCLTSFADCVIAVALGQTMGIAVEKAYMLP